MKHQRKKQRNSAKKTKGIKEQTKDINEKTMNRLRKKAKKINKKQRGSQNKHWKSMKKKIIILKIRAYFLFKCLPKVHHLLSSSLIQGMVASFNKINSIKTDQL